MLSGNFDVKLDDSYATSVNLHLFYIIVTLLYVNSIMVGLFFFFFLNT